MSLFSDAHISQIAEIPLNKRVIEALEKAEHTITETRQHPHTTTQDAVMMGILLGFDSVKRALNGDFHALSLWMDKNSVLRFMYASETSVPPLPQHE